MGDLTGYTDEELERIARQHALAQMSDEELERIAAPAARSQGPSWRDQLAMRALRAVPGADLILPPEGGSTAQFQQGVTMGWADELYAARDAGLAALRGGSLSPEQTVAGLITGKRGEGSSVSETYDASLARQAAEREAYSRENPKLAGAAEIAGGLAGAGKIGGAVKAGKTFFRALPQLIATGAGTGFVAGAGTAEQGEGLEGGRDGAVIGSVLGPLAAAGTNAVGGAYRMAANMMRPTRAADEAVVAALQRDGMSVDALRQAASDNPRGVPASLADVSSPGVQSLLSGAAVKPGKAQQIVTETMERRLANQPDRVKSALASAAGPREYAIALAEEVKRTRWETAAPLYAKAFEAGPVTSARMLEILKDPDVSKAFGTATKIAEREGIELPPVYRLGTSDNPGKLAIERLPDVRTLDYVKRALDGEIDSGFRNGNTANAASLKKLRNELVDLIDKHSPEYRLARAAYAGDSEVLEAIELGSKAHTMADGRLAATVKAFKSDAEREAFRKSALDALNDRINSRDGAGVLDELLKSDKKRRNLETIVGDKKAYAELSRKLLAEKRIRDTGGRINPRVGSPSAIRAGDAAALPGTVHAAQRASEGTGLAGLAVQGLRALYRGGTGLSDAGGGHIAEKLMTANKDAQRRYLGELTEAASRMGARDARRKRGWLGASGFAGAAPGLLGQEN